jgi:hypothetical protein
MTVPGIIKIICERIFYEKRLPDLVPSPQLERRTTGVVGGGGTGLDDQSEIRCRACALRKY